MRVRPTYNEALRLSRTLTILADFDARVAGTLPIGVALPDSDIDVICHIGDTERFVATIWSEFAAYPQFMLRQWVGDGRPIIASFVAHDWPIEIFGQAIPVDEQAAWRHFSVERRLLTLGGDEFRKAVMARRRSGAKTEAAFAAVLHLDGDPYRSMFEIASLSDKALMDLILQSRGKRPDIVPQQTNSRRPPVVAG